jgi:hypothetical protein
MFMSHYGEKHILHRSLQHIGQIVQLVFSGRSQEINPLLPVLVESEVRLSGH